MKIVSLIVLWTETPYLLFSVNLDQPIIFLDTKKCNEGADEQWTVIYYIEQGIDLNPQKSFFDLGCETNKNANFIVVVSMLRKHYQ